MAENQTVAIAAISLTGAICAGFFKLVSAQNKTHERIAKAVDNLAKQSGKIVSSNREIAQATKQSANEAQERNGHLADLVIQQGKMTQQVTAKAIEEIIKGVSEVNKQKVHTQVVDKAVIKKEESK